jgi:hypothetical protein
MRRPPIACRRAVQSLQPGATPHIWVSDELLSSTFHRFFRDTCPHQRRHGSHVPGPLEARRRATKRRMTVSAGFYPQDSLPLTFNLGALFGFRSNQPPWRYEPPSLLRQAEPLDTGAHRDAYSRSHKAYNEIRGRYGFHSQAQLPQSTRDAPIIFGIFFAQCNILFRAKCCLHA